MSSSDSLGSRRSSKDVLQSTLSSLQHLNLSDQVLPDGPVLKAHGGFCDVFQGRRIIKGECIYKVAIKRLRVHIQSDRDFAKQLAKEIRVWSKLAHRNVLPLLGYVIEGDYPSLVSEWMDRGTVSHYMQSHPETNLLSMVLGIAKGIEYLHDEGVIHSDIKSDNVLVSATGVPRICDFGISRVLAASQSFGKTSTQTGGIKGSVRWMAPELLAVSSGPQPEHSMETDVYAFGMTVYELLTNQAPYSYLKRDVQVMFAILQGIPPECPEAYFTWPLCYRKLWSICVVSWNWNPSLRKPMREVVSYLQVLCRRSDEERFLYYEEPLYSGFDERSQSYEESLFSSSDERPNSVYRQPSILGQDRATTSFSNLQEYESDHHTIRTADETSHEPQRHTPAFLTLKTINTTGSSQRQRQRQRYEHQRASSLGHQHYSIRDFDLGGSGPLLTQTKEHRQKSSLPTRPDQAECSSRSEQSANFIEKQQQNLRPVYVRQRTDVPLESRRGPIEPLPMETLGEAIFDDVQKSDDSPIGSSTLGKTIRAGNMPEITSSIINLPHSSNQPTNQTESLSNSKASSAIRPPSQRAIRRRAGSFCLKSKANVGKGMSV